MCNDSLLNLLLAFISCLALPFQLDHIGLIYGTVSHDVFGDLSSVPLTPSTIRILASQGSGLP